MLQIDNIDEIYKVDNNSKQLIKKMKKSTLNQNIAKESKKSAIIVSFYMLVLISGVILSVI
tara:strand:- start:8 stop:190 length:183 start_codon:yes stop_codon:yes gene_type:complete